MNSPGPGLLLMQAGAALAGSLAAVAAIRALAGGVFPRPGTRGFAWGIALVLLWSAGGAVLVTRFTLGLGATTNLTDSTPWGLWVSFNVVCGVALSAGGFVTAGTVHVLRLDRFGSILRPAILTAFLGYILVSTGMLVELGRPYNIWHTMIYWQHRSVLFEVAWCVMLYTAVLGMEFLPVVLERFRLERFLPLWKWLTVPLVITGCILSSMHQSSLGALFLIVPHKLLPLWYSPLLPVFFLLSAVTVGLAMLIFESTLSARAFNRHLEEPVVSSLARAMGPLLVAYIFLRLVDITVREGWAVIPTHPFQAATFLLEMVLLALPALILWIPGRPDTAIHRPGQHPVPAGTAFRCSVLVIMGVVLNRFNVSWLGMPPATGPMYFPSWQEIVVTLNLVSAWVVVFGLAARYLPLFENPGSGKPPSGEGI